MNIKKYKVYITEKEYKLFTLKEIIDINAKKLATFYIQNKSINENTLNSFPKTIKTKINWYRVSVKELKDIGFSKWGKNKYIIPPHIWNLIPIGTKLYSIKKKKYFNKIGNEDLNETIFGYLPYGFVKKEK